MLQDSSIADDLSIFYSFTSSDFKNRFGIPANTAQLLTNGLRDKKLLEKELALLEKHPDISWISILSDSYPALLKEIHQPPIGLYYRGRDLADFDSCLAIVGARKGDSYARRVIDYIVPDLVANKWCIVSGGARGVDSMAHQKTVDEKGATIAVLGSGLLELYPRENEKLFESIVYTGGSIVSAFPLQMPPIPQNFPIRNRIISGLSRGTLVVQAAKRSGSLITANCALEQGREVFAVPGPIDDTLSVGCHNLITQGAKLVGSADDIFQEMSDTFVPAKKAQKSIFEPVAQDPFLSYCEKPIAMEQLAKISGIGLQELQSKLFDLQLEGKISQNFAGLWQRV